KVAAPVTRLISEDYFCRNDQKRGLARKQDPPVGLVPLPGPNIAARVGAGRGCRRTGLQKAHGIGLFPMGIRVRSGTLRQYPCLHAISAISLISEAYFGPKPQKRALA